MHMIVNIDRYIEDMEQWKKTREENERLQQELQRKDNIIDELENFIKDKSVIYEINTQIYSYDICCQILDKLKELKERK